MNARLLVVTSLALSLRVSVSGQPPVLNGSFEDGTTDPTGWQLSAGVGEWEKEGHTGSRCISVAGDGTSSNFWSCPSFQLSSGTLYRLEFWTKSSRDAGSGCVISGTSHCNMDWPHTREWTRRVFVFRSLNRREPQFLRFGQWQAKGEVYFDDIRISEINPVSSMPEMVTVREGETIRSGRYVFVAPLKQNLNFSRPLVTCTAGFNSDRWVLNGDAELRFVFLILQGVADLKKPGAGKIKKLRLSDPRVEVDVGYYTAGRCLIEASLDETTWTTVGVINRERSAEFHLPRSFDGAFGITIRLVGKKKEGETEPCSLQVHGFRFSAAVENRNLNLFGTAYFPREEPFVPFFEKPGTARPHQTPALWLKLLNVGTPSFGGRNRLCIMDASSPTKPVQVLPVLSIDGVRQTYPYYTIAAIPVGARVARDINLDYDAGHTGEHEAKVSLLDVKTSKTLYEATWEYRVPPLYDSGFGYAITSTTECDLWWAEGSHKINRRCPTPKRRQAIVVSAAKGEYEPFQLVIAPKRDLKKVAVKVSALQAGRGETIPAEVVEVCRVGYVNVTTPTDEIGCAGEWPDPLPPCDKPFDLRSDDGCQPLWITVHVPRNAKAGDYRATIELAAVGWKTSVPFTLHVWDFEIPRENHLKTAFGFSTGNVKRYHNLTTDDELRKVSDLYFQNFAEHRIAPYDFSPFDPIRVQFPETPDGDVKLDFSRFDPQAEKYFGPEYRFSTFRLPLQGMGGGTFHSRRPGKIGRFEQGSAEYEKIFANYLRAIESHLREKGWLGKAYVYWFDEPEPKDYAFVREGMERIHRAAPGLRRMLTEQPEKELDGAVDIWCPVSPNVKPDDMANERAKGNEFWWYICTGPKGPYCTLFIDHYTIEFRMWSWQTWKTGVQGLLIWQSNYWTSDAAFPAPQIQNPWEDPMSYVSGYSTPAGTKKHWGNGDGRFIYPPNRDPVNDKSKYLVGPVNSIRWEMLREGIEDYEYFWLLRDLVEKAKKRAIVVGERSDLIERFEKLLSIPDSITRDQTHFTKDPLELYQYREQVARAIETLSNGK